MTDFSTAYDLNDSMRDRLAGQPVWVRTFIGQLVDELNFRSRDLADSRQEAATLRQQLQQDPASQEATTYADPHDPTPRPIGRNPIIEHRMENGRTVLVEFHPRTVLVQDNTPSTVRPWPDRGILVNPVSTTTVTVVHRDAYAPQAAPDPQEAPSVD